MIRKYYIDGIYLFSIIDNLAYLDINLNSNKDVEGWEDVEIPTEYGKVVKLLYCRSRLFAKVCGAIVKLDKAVNEDEVNGAYAAIVQEIRKAIGNP